MAKRIQKYIRRIGQKTGMSKNEKKVQNKDMTTDLVEEYLQRIPLKEKFRESIFLNQFLYIS